MRSVKLVDNRLILECEYNPVLVEAIKEIPGRMFDKTKRVWVVPVDGLYNENKSRLQSLNFNVSELPDGFSEATSLYGINSKLYGYQQNGVTRILCDKLLLVGDEPGLGKTIQVIEACRLMGLKKVLVITMSSLKWQFASELAKWHPDATCQVIDGDKFERTVQWGQDANFYVMNYELLLRDQEPFMHKYDLIVCDESTRLSNHANKQWIAASKLKSERRVAMTGTAVSNSPIDLFGILNWLSPHCLGTWTNFCERYVIFDQYRVARDFMRLDELSKRIQPFYIRRTKDQVLKELPPKIYSTVPVVLSEPERKLYNQIRDRLLFEIEASDVSKVEYVSQLGNGLVAMTRLQQCCLSLELLGDRSSSSKLEALKELLLSLSGHKVIIFCEYAAMCKIIHREIPGSKMLIGATPSEERVEIVKDFEILIMSSAGSWGLNLQSADVIVHYNLPWSVAKKEQREGRAHRIGQTKPVNIYSLIVEQSIEKYISKKLSLKQEVSEKLMPVSEIREMLNEAN